LKSLYFLFLKSEDAEDGEKAKEEAVRPSTREEAQAGQRQDPQISAKETG
jgi:hypothetical protein